jgi:malate dehydrogenase (quinone)
MPVHYDAVFVGGGIMSMTLATLLRKLEPSWKMAVVEKLDQVALESSNGWNNAGTGHSALCELNYTPRLDDGTIDTSKAVAINKQFQVSRELWSALVEAGDLPEPDLFIRKSPHISLVFGEKNVNFLRDRYAALKPHPLFSSMEYSEDPIEIGSWAPLTIDGRLKGEPIAATRVVEGTDVDFGVLTRASADQLALNGVEFVFETAVTGLKKKKGHWDLVLRNEIGHTRTYISSNFVFVGAGGAALTLLQRSGIREIRGYGGFPVSGEWLKCDNPEVVEQHSSKVYGMAELGAPPMSVPHLDSRVVEGQNSLLFGPYAGFTPKFLKRGSWLDLFGSLRWHNIGPMVAVGLTNFGLLTYLIREVLSSRQRKLESLYRYFPGANPDDWKPEIAGQRVQIIKPDPKRLGVLQFGTEVVAASDGSIAGLLGASPGASTAPSIMLGLLEKCFPDEVQRWETVLSALIPSYRIGELCTDSEAAVSQRKTSRVLKL